MQILLQKHKLDKTFPTETDLAGLTEHKTDQEHYHMSYCYKLSINTCKLSSRQWAGGLADQEVWLSGQTAISEA